MSYSSIAARAARPSSSASSAAASSSPSSALSISGEGINQAQAPSERTHYIAMNLIGQQVCVLLKDGTIYEGLFHNPVFDRGFGVVLKMARKKENGQPESLITTPPINQIIVSPQELVMIEAPEVAFVEDSPDFKKKKLKGGFKTDTEISATDFSERELVPWISPDESESMRGLEDEQGSQRGRSWDQFEANERLFGVRTSYDERYYTTEIDQKKLPREVVEKAHRIEKEITSQNTGNTHLAEERGTVAPRDDTEDEEDKYSSVLRESKGITAAQRHEREERPTGNLGTRSNMYVVPAKRRKELQQQLQHATEKDKEETDEEKKQRQDEQRRLQDVERQVEAEHEKDRERQKVSQREKERSYSDDINSNEESSAVCLRSRSTTDLAVHQRPPSFSPAPNLAKFPLRQRSFSMSNLALASDSNLGYLKLRQSVNYPRSPSVEPRAATEKLKEESNRSPRIGSQIRSLDLSPAVPRVAEKVLQDFKQFKIGRSSASPAMLSKQELASFSKDLEKRTSAPNSPTQRFRKIDHVPSLLSSRRAPTETSPHKHEKETSQKPQTAAAAAAAPPQPSVPTQQKASATTPATSEAAAPKETATPRAVEGTSGSGLKLQAKSKLNPFAKAFTPKTRLTPPTSSGTEKSISPPGSAAATDINTPISSLYAQGMRRLQESQEDPEQVVPIWPYGRWQDEIGIPMEGFYPVPSMSPLPPQGHRPMGYPISYGTSPPQQMAGGQPVVMFPQPVPRGFVQPGQGMSFYPPTGPGGQPYPPHLYTGPVPAQGPKGRMGGPYPHAHIPQAGGAAPFPPNSPPPYGVPPQPELGTSVSPHTQGTPPHSPHAPRVQPHMWDPQGVPMSPTQPMYSFGPAGPHILGDPLAGRGPHQQVPQMVVPNMSAPRGGYRYVQQGQQQGPPPQFISARQDSNSSSGESAKSSHQAQPFQPRQANPSPAVSGGGGAVYFPLPGQQQRSLRNSSTGQQQLQDKDGAQRFKVPNTDVLPHQ